MRPTALLFTLLLASSIHAQCAVKGASFRAYGQSCPANSTWAPALTGNFQPTACTIALTIRADRGCCNEYLSGRMLMFGASPANIPLSFLGLPTCSLLVQPQFFFTWSNTTSGTMTINLPSNTSPGTVYVQGVASYYYTLGRRTKYRLSRGLAVTIW